MCRCSCTLALHAHVAPATCAFPFAVQKRHVLLELYQRQVDVCATATALQGAAGTATSEGGCGCSKRCGCEEKSEDYYYSDNPWEGTIGREEFLDALGAGPNAVGRVSLWPVSSFPSS